jgi:uncharacterized protein YktA (UPF0223 family)
MKKIKKNKMKQTAVEWLDKQITICFENYSGTRLYHRIEDKIEQAKEMEKQKIKNVFEEGFVTQEELLEIYKRENEL